jgi:hypothetical protein
MRSGQESDHHLKGTQTECSRALPQFGSSGFALHDRSVPRPPRDTKFNTREEAVAGGPTNCTHEVNVVHLTRKRELLSCRAPATIFLKRVSSESSFCNS